MENTSKFHTTKHTSVRPLDMLVSTKTEGAQN